MISLVEIRSTFRFCGLALLLAQCAPAPPRVADALQAREDVRERTLTDPGLGAFLDANKLSKGWPPTGWDLDLLTGAALYYHPDVDVARSLVAVAEAQEVTAGAKPNPTLSFTGENVADAVTGLSPWIGGLNLDLPFETAGKRGIRVAKAEHVTQASRLDLAQVGWKVRSRLRGAVVALLVARRHVEILRTEGDLRHEAVLVIQRRFEVGEVSRPDVDTAATDEMTATLQLRGAEGDVGRTEAELAAAIAVPVRALRDVVVSWPDLEEPPDAATLAADDMQRTALLNRLEVRASLEEYAAAHAAFALELQKRIPDLHLGPGFTYDQGAAKFSIGLSLEIPIFNHNEGPLGEAAAHLHELEARFLALQARIIAESETSLARYRAAFQEVVESTTLGRTLSDREKSLARAVELGEQDRLALLDLRIQKAAAARARLESARKAQEALGALEDALERPLTASSIAPEVPAASPRAERTTSMKSEEPTR